MPCLLGHHQGHLRAFGVLTEVGEGPACIIDFLGIVLDAIRMEIRLPEEKAQQLQALVKEAVM